MRTLHVCVLATLLACDVDAPSAADRDLARTLREIRERMHVRFAATNGILDGIAGGDMPRVQADARLVADLDEAAVAPAWKPYLEDVRAAAAALATTEDPGAAAMQLARLGAACARCHEAVPGVKTAFPAAAPLPRREHLRDTMVGHGWAVARMWEGLIGPSPARWDEGAAALEQAPLAVTAEGDVPGHQLGIADDVARLRLLATRARTAATTAERSETYGRLLGTCARCHHTIRDR